MTTELKEIQTPQEKLKTYDACTKPFISYEPDHKPTISKREVVAWAALAANLAAVVALVYWWVVV